MFVLFCSYGCMQMHVCMHTYTCIFIEKQRILQFGKIAFNFFKIKIPNYREFHDKF